MPRISSQRTGTQAIATGEPRPTRVPHYRKSALIKKLSLLIDLPGFYRDRLLKEPFVSLRILTERLDSAADLSKAMAKYPKRRTQLVSNLLHLEDLAPLRMLLLNEPKQTLTYDELRELNNRAKVNGQAQPMSFILRQIDRLFILLSLCDNAELKGTLFGSFIPLQVLFEPLPNKEALLEAIKRYGQITADVRPSGYVLLFRDATRLKNLVEDDQRVRFTFADLIMLNMKIQEARTAYPANQNTALEFSLASLEPVNNTLLSS